MHIINILIYASFDFNFYCFEFIFVVYSFFQLNLLLRSDAEKKIQHIYEIQEETNTENQKYRIKKDEILERTKSSKESYKEM
jgi:hypothetical protein